MSKKKLLALLIPAVSFLSGVFAQVLLDQWISSKNIILLSIALAIISLITIFIILKYLETRFDGFDSKLMRTANRMGIYVEYIEDGETGKSYIRSADLVEQSYSQNKAQVRYGALIFDDMQGDLVRYLKSIFSTLDGCSRSIELQQLLDSE